jgi:hypothetical protein
MAANVEALTQQQELSMATSLQSSAPGAPDAGASLRLRGSMPLIFMLSRICLGVLLAFVSVPEIWADGASPKAVQSVDPNDFVQVRNGKFVLAGKPFVIRGTNYFGSWRYRHTIDVDDGTEHRIEWAFYHDWDSTKLDLDFRFIRSQLNATSVRIGTPGMEAFEPLVKFHHYQPWYDAQGQITEPYRTELIKMADIAYADGIRIQFTLIWNLKREIAKDPDSFKAGGTMDRLYANQVTSIVAALHNHPGVIGYSIGNEVLVEFEINGKHPSSYEGIAAGFIMRRLKEVRAAAPLQLVTLDEGGNGQNKWWAPEMAFVMLPDVDAGNGRESIRLADHVDYLGTHFYPETLEMEDLSGGFAGKVADARQKLASYMQVARKFGKPVVLSEIGLRVAPMTLPPNQYSAYRDQFWQAMMAESQSQGLQGVLAWAAIPDVELVPGQYVFKGSAVNEKSRVELDLNGPDHTQRRLLMVHPEWYLFEWRGDAALPPVPTPAAAAIASAWADIPPPPLPAQIVRP